MLLNQEPLGRSWLLSFCYCSNRIWKQGKWFLVYIVGFWISLFFSLYWLQRKKKKSNALYSDGALYLPFLAMISLSLSSDSSMSLCDPCIMTFYFPKVKPSLVPRVSWKEGCFLWFLFVGSSVHRLLEKKGPQRSLKTAPVLITEKEGKLNGFPKSDTAN